MAARGSETDPGPRSLAGPASPSAGQRALPGTAQADDSPPGVWEEEAATCAATRSDGQNHHVGAPGCAEAAVCAFKARASGPAPACPRGTVPPRPRSPVRRPSFTSRGAPTRLCFLPLATEETDEDDGRHVLCAVCHARSGVCQACARRCPACRPALSPSALTTGGRVRARFRLRHAGPESVPQHSGPRSPLSGVPLRPAWVHSAVLPRLPPSPPLWPCPSAVPPLVAARHPQRPA